MLLYNQCSVAVFTIHLVLRRGERAPEQGQIRQKSFLHQNNVPSLLLISRSSFSCPFKLAFVLLSGKQVPGWWVLTGRTSCVLGCEWLNQRHNKKRHIQNYTEPDGVFKYTTQVWVWLHEHECISSFCFTARIFAQACLKGSDLICSTWKLNRRGIKALCCMWVTIHHWYDG